MHFADDLIEKSKKTSNIVVGIDPNFDLMADNFLPKNSSRNCIKKSLIAGLYPSGG